jgi:hypothetical protein
VVKGVETPSINIVFVTASATLKAQVSKAFRKLQVSLREPTSSNARDQFEGDNDSISVITKSQKEVIPPSPRALQKDGPV